VDEKFERPGVHIIMDRSFEFPMLDVDEKMNISELRLKMHNIIDRYQLGQYIVVETKKGYKVAFTHDAGRRKTEIDGIIKSFVDAGLCDRRFYRVGMVQQWRGWRITGKYSIDDMKIVGTFLTKHPGKPSPLTPMLDAMFGAFYLRF
jgi:hypothetical protein